MNKLQRMFFRVQIAKAIIKKRSSTLRFGWHVDTARLFGAAIEKTDRQVV